ncbi:MAG: TRAP transporter large permease subunit [Syntrophobacteraceae bacterium]|jgi:tripartite ATP-independent transporter DctM subunit|nr:TRAP transporter large permease subunit [Syntrophobacteraceae bacterium]
MNSLYAVLLSLAALSGAPLFSVIAGASIMAFLALEIDLSLVIIEMYRLASNPMLVALLLFALAGYMLAESQASRRLVRLSLALLGRAPGGLAIVALLTSAFFTALTGASGITIVALGGLLLPALLQDRYSEKFSLGLLTTCGSLGLLFPPSLPLIVYGMVAEVKISELFVAGILPGLLMLTLLALYSIWHGARGRSPAPAGGGGEATVSIAEALSALREAVWELLLPVVVIGGIFSGFLAVSEAAAVTVLYVVLVEGVIHREVKVGDLPPILLKTAVMVGAIVVILGASLAFNSFLVDQQVPNRILAFMRSHVHSRIGFLVILNLFLLGVGCLLDMFSALVIVVPLIIPIAQSYGVDLLHLGIIFLTNLQIGYSTPPVGMDLFIASLRFDKPVLYLYVASLPFLAILLATLAVITFVPSLTLVLAR